MEIMRSAEEGRLGNGPGKAKEKMGGDLLKSKSEVCMGTRRRDWAPRKVPKTKLFYRKTAPKSYGRRALENDSKWLSRRNKSPDDAGETGPTVFSDISRS